MDPFAFHTHRIVPNEQVERRILEATEPVERLRKLERLQTVLSRVRPMELAFAAFYLAGIAVFIMVVISGN